MKKLLKIMCCLSLMTGNNSNAQSPGSIISSSDNEVVLLEKGVESPFRGYLFPPDKALDFRKQLIELDNLKALESSYNKSIELYKKNEDVYNFKVNTMLYLKIFRELRGYQPSLV